MRGGEEEKNQWRRKNINEGSERIERRERIKTNKKRNYEKQGM